MYEDSHAASCWDRSARIAFRDASSALSVVVVAPFFSLLQREGVERATPARSQMTYICTPEALALANRRSTGSSVCMRGAY